MRGKLNRIVLAGLVIGGLTTSMAMSPAASAAPVHATPIHAVPAPRAASVTTSSTTDWRAQSATEQATLRAQAAAKLPAPTITSMTFTDNAVLLTWTKVKKAKKYNVIISKKGYFGPFRDWQTKKTHIKIKYTGFPYRDGSGKPYKFSVGSVNGKRTSISGYPHIKKKEIIKKTVRTKKVSKATFKKRAKSLAKKCFKDGAAAAIGTGAAGGILLAVTSWIPPAEAVTATGVALAAGSAGVGTTVACVVIH